MNEKVKNIETQILSDNWYTLKKVTYEAEKEGGEKEEVVREVYQTKDAATVLLYNLKRETVILTNQFRLPSYLNKNATGMLLEACAGIVEKNENPDEGILREIAEETGFEVQQAVKLFELYSTAGSVTEILHYYGAEYSPKDKTGEGGGLEEEHEDIEVVEMLFDDAYSKIKSGEIKDAKTVILLQYAKLNLFR